MKTDLKNRWKGSQASVFTLEDQSETYSAYSIRQPAMFSFCSRFIKSVQTLQRLTAVFCRRQRQRVENTSSHLI